MRVGNYIDGGDKQRESSEIIMVAEFTPRRTVKNIFTISAKAEQSEKKLDLLGLSVFPSDMDRGTSSIQYSFVQYIEYSNFVDGARELLQ